ncbi:MAG: hypothetical protein IKT97_07355 [Spirochaetia bacterium]|nr:hypothetical protein [Spirochaetia bacterium]
MKKTIIFKSLLFILVLIGLLYPVNYVMRGDKHESSAVAGFDKEKKDTIDAVFLGSSQVFVSIIPMEIWNNTHIRSYNLGASATNIPTMYYLAKMAIRKQHPKIIIADMGFIYSNNKIEGSERFHAVFDNFFLLKEKYEALFNLVDKKDWYEIIYPLRIYHSGWKEINKKYFISLEDKNMLKGSFLSAAKTPIDFSFQLTGEKKEIPQPTLEYIVKLINLCKENNVKLVLVNYPLEIYSQKYGFDSYFGYLLSLEELARYYNVPYYNGYIDNNHWGLDYEVDFRDPAHVNISGALKISNFMGKILEENNQIWRENKNADDIWDSQYIKYIIYLKNF